MVPIKKTETLGYLEIAIRVKQYATAILRYAVQQKIIRFNPAYDLEGAVQKPQTEHRPAIELEDIQHFWNVLMVIRDVAGSRYWRSSSIS